MSPTFESKPFVHPSAGDKRKMVGVGVGVGGYSGMGAGTGTGTGATVASKAKADVKGRPAFVSAFISEARVAVDINRAGVLSDLLTLVSTDMPRENPSKVAALRDISQKITKNLKNLLTNVNVAPPLPSILLGEITPRKYVMIIHDIFALFILFRCVLISHLLSSHSIFHK